MTTRSPTQQQPDRRVLLDPTTRSAVAAPGRALKLSLTAQF